MTLARDLDRANEEIKQLKQTVIHHALLIQKLSDQIEMYQQREQDAREKVILQLQIEMLKFEKRLPSAQIDEEQKKK